MEYQVKYRESFKERIGLCGFDADVFTIWCVVIVVLSRSLLGYREIRHGVVADVDSDCFPGSNVCGYFGPRQWTNE